jgi:hypothetical protein
MKHYCMGELKMSEDIANKRMWVARRARKFPRILVGLNEGSLTLTAVAMLTRYLTGKNAEDLLAAAAHKTNAQIAELIAHHFPRQDLPTLVQPLISQQPLAPPESVPQNAPSIAPLPGLDCQEAAARQLAGPVEVPVIQTRVTPLAPQRYGVQFTISQSDRELLRHVQDLLSYRDGTLDEAQVFVCALRELAARLDKKKFGATERPHQSSRESKNPRHIPARVRREVRERDGGQCTFVAAGGHRCEARRFLEFDHVEPVAQGGKSTAANLRLRCRAHNQYGAEQSYGREFMKYKVEQAREARGASVAAGG